MRLHVLISYNLSYYIHVFFSATSFNQQESAEKQNCITVAPNKKHMKMIPRSWCLNISHHSLFDPKNKRKEFPAAWRLKQKQTCAITQYSLQCLQVSHYWYVIYSFLMIATSAKNEVPEKYHGCYLSSGGTFSILIFQDAFSFPFYKSVFLVSLVDLATYMVRWSDLALLWT